MTVNIISDEKLGELLAASPAERVTKEYIESRIALAPVFTRLGKTITHCRIVLDNGFSVSGESACVNPENYNQQIGEKIAYENAFRQLWPLFGFLLAEKNKLRGEGNCGAVSAPAPATEPAGEPQPTSDGTAAGSADAPQTEAAA